MNCTKCNKEIEYNEWYLKNTYCTECWPAVTRLEKRKLPGFCPKCGCGTWYGDPHYHISTCGECGFIKRHELPTDTE